MNMCPLIHVGALEVESYALMTYVGFFIAASYFYTRLVKSEKIDRFQVLLFLTALFFAQLAGGTIIPFFWSWHRRGAFPSHFFTGHSGRFFHSVFLSAIAFVIAYCKIKKWPTKRTLDYLAVSTGIMSPIGRIGCFLAGCCAGKPTTLPWAVKFPNKPFPVHPTQLYHFGVELFILLPILLWIDKKKQFDGQTFWSYLFLYSIFRFGIEYIRINPIAWMSLTHAQLFSIAAVLVASTVLAKQLFRSVR